MKWDELDVEIALQMVLKHWKQTQKLTSASQLHIYLGLDEIIRIEDAQKLSTLMTHLGTLLDTNIQVSCAGTEIEAFFSCLITTLDAKKVFEASITKSGRQIRFIPLWPLSIPAALTLFHDFKNVEAQVMWAFMADCGGHPQMLEICNRVLNRLPFEIDMDDYRTISKLFVAEFAKVSRLSVGYNLYYLLYPLQGKTLKLGDDSLNVTGTAMHYIEKFDQCGILSWLYYWPF
jgi:hypothetical protein